MIGGFATFCDDIRDEVGGKYSVIGCYRSNLVTVNPFPLTLPKLGIIVTWLQTLDEAPLPVTLNLYLPGDEAEPSVTGEMDLTQMGPPPPSDLTDDARYLQAQLRIMLSPVNLKEAGHIRITAKRDGKTVSISRFEITHVDALTDEQRAQLS
jgi:hypothetical protein